MGFSGFDGINSFFEDEYAWLWVIVILVILWIVLAEEN